MLNKSIIEMWKAAKALTLDVVSLPVRVPIEMYTIARAHGRSPFAALKPATFVALLQCAPAVATIGVNMMMDPPKVGEVASLLYAGAVGSLIFSAYIGATTTDGPTLPRTSVRRTQKQLMVNSR